MRPFAWFVRWPFLAVYAMSSRRAVIATDVARWREALNWPPASDSSTLLRLAGPRTREFRNLFCHRLSQGTGVDRILGRALRAVYPGERTLFISTPNIGPGLFIQHGFATIIAATEIGANCWINQQVTIGHVYDRGSPVIGDGVTVAAGAVVVGGIKVADHATIGANATVTKDVPSGAVMVGNPARELAPRSPRRR